MWTIILKPFLFIFATLFAILATISLPIVLLPIWLTFLIYKTLIVLIAKCLYPEATLLRPMDRIMAMGETNKVNHFYVSLCLIVEGKICVEAAEKEMTEKIINKKYPNGKLQFPQMQQYIRKFGGYSFWEWDRSFKITEQIHLFPTNATTEENVPVISKEKLLSIRKDFQEKVFKDKKPVWEMLIVNNYKDEHYSSDKEYSAVIFKFHHALADGFASLKLVWVHLGGKPLSSMLKPRELTSRPNAFYNVFLILIRSIQIPILASLYFFEFLFNLVYNQDKFFDRHPWHLPVKKKFRNHQVCVLAPINKKLVREIKSTHKASVTSILMTLALGGIKRMMAAKKLNLPKHVKVSFPIPKPNHPDYLTNHARAVELWAPFSNEDPIVRLKKTDRNILRSLEGPTPYIIEMGVNVLSCFPYWLLRKIADEQLISVYFASTPMPSESFDLFGCPVVGINHYLIVTQSNGIAVGVGSFGNDFNLTVQIENYFLNYPEEVNDIEKYILEELDSLCKTTI